LNAEDVCGSLKATRNLFAAFGLIANASSVVPMTGNFFTLPNNCVFCMQSG